MASYHSLTIFLVLFLLATSAWGSEPEDQKEAGQEGWISLLDIVILGAIVLGLVYWFKPGSKPEEPDTFKKLTVVPPSGIRQDKSFIGKMRKGNRNVVVFYGSQTGTAEEFATRLVKDCHRYGMKGMPADPEECDSDDIPKLAEIEKSLAIFCLATYGEGDPTDNAQELYDWLQETDADLTGITFAVFALGNTTYEHYNSMGKYVDKRLAELGATRVFELGMGDDDGSIEEDFLTWRDKFWPAVCQHYGVEAVADDVNVRQYSLTIHNEIEPEKVFKGEVGRLGAFVNQKPPYDAKNPYLAAVTENRELHQGGDRTCKHLEFDISGSRIRYEAGDHVAVYPVNDAILVDAIGTRLSADLDQAFTLTNVDEEASKKHPFPCPCTFRTALSHYLDITNPPRTNVLKELAEYCSDAEDKQFLLKMGQTSDEAKELYHNWILNDCRTILSVLEDVKSCAPPVDHLCELLPKLQPRYYSISSSPKMNPTSVHITAVVVEYETPTGRTNKGVATNWLALKRPAAQIQPKVPVYIRKSQFRLPFKHNTPVIMIGPGTGLAPFRGFIQERHVAKEQGKPVGETVLYFGCRHEKEDYLYADELQKYKEGGTITQLHLAFSRDGPEKVYVQNLVRREADNVWRLLEDGAHIYICGDARHMAQDVRNTLLDIISQKGGKTHSEAEDYLKRLHSRGRYSTDVWS